MKPRTLIFCLFLGLGATVPASGIPTDRRPHARIIEYGLYQADGEEIIVNEPRSSSGKMRLTTAGHFYAHTDRVPLRLGVYFDIYFEITGITGGDTIEVQKKVEHPAFKNYKGQLETHYTVPLELNVVNGRAEELTGVVLAHQEELVPGVWKFEIWYQNQKLLTQSFTVYAPE